MRIRSGMPMKRLLALVAVLSLVLAACGGDDDGTAAEDGANDARRAAEGESDEELDHDPEGIVRLGYDLVSASRGGFSFDPRHQQTQASDLGVYHWVYGALLRPAPDGTLVPDLAEQAEVVDETTIEVVLRDGLTLNDGAPLDAELVKTVLEDNLAATETQAYQESFFSLSEVEVTSPTSLTLMIGDGTAHGWFDQHIAGVETLIVPPGTDFEDPVGAGPYRVTSIETEQRVSLERNPSYWDADSMRVAGIELIHVSPEGTAPPNAINAGQVDFVRLGTKDMVNAIGGDAELLIEPDPYGLATVLWCKSETPFDDVRVRQAMSYAIDREAINEVMFDGEGLPAWDVWPQGHRFYNQDWEEHYAHDPEQARELLDEAGYADGFQIDFMPHPSVSDMAQIMQQQWADVGIQVELLSTTNYAQDALVDMRAPMTMIPVNPAGSGRIPHWVGDAITNLCDYSDPELDALAEDLQAVSDSNDEAVDIWAQISDIVMEDLLSLFVTYQPLYNAYLPDRIGDVEMSPYTIIVPDMWQLHVKA